MVNLWIFFVELTSKKPLTSTNFRQIDLTLAKCIIMGQTCGLI